MRRLTVLVPALLLCTALAGCSDGGGAAAEDQARHGTGMDPGLAPAEAPAWKLGDYWTYKDSIGNTYSLVVAEDAGGDWMLLSNDRTIALFDLRFDISFVGKVRKGDLAGDQGGSRIQFFDFPLHHGKDWTTQWDGQNRHVVAEGMADGSYHIIAHVAGNEVGDQYASYHYDPAVGFFGQLTFYDGQGGVAYEATLQDHGEGFQGTAVRYTEERELASTHVFGPGTPQGTFGVGDEAGELSVSAFVHCGTSPGYVPFAVQEPQEDGSQAPAPPTPIVATGQPVLGNDQPCPEAQGWYNTTIDAPRPGTWRYDAAVAGQDAGFVLGVSFLVRQDIPL